MRISISIGSKLSASSLVQANGGNDTIYIAGDVLGSTAYGGQGNDTIDGVAATAIQSLSGSLLEGNRGNDKIVFRSTYWSSILRFTVPIQPELSPVMTLWHWVVSPFRPLRFMAVQVMTPFLLVTTTTRVAKF